MLLSNLDIIGQKGLKKIYIKDGIIRSVLNNEQSVLATENEFNIYFEDAIAFPGLINSHDHLDFNLFPKMKTRIYGNYTEWGSDIHQSNKKIIDTVLDIPQDLRIQWGVYKNLLNGITTVINHGIKLKIKEHIISVHQESNSWHSISGEKGWRSKLIHPFKKNKPIVIHVGEGTDALAASEIDQLIQWNIFKKDIIAIHGVVMNEKQASFFKALVWCPDSNLFLLGRTSNIDRLKNKVKILFGTDSTLTASWNIWEQLRLARSLQMMSDADLFDAITSAAATAWSLQNTGSIAEYKDADIVIARKKKNLSEWDNFYALNPEDILLVLHKGNIRLFDADIRSQLIEPNFSSNDFYKISINGTHKYIYGNLPALMNEIRKHHPSGNFPVTIDN